MKKSKVKNFYFVEGAKIVDKTNNANGLLDSLPRVPIEQAIKILRKYEKKTR